MTDISDEQLERERLEHRWHGAYEGVDDYAEWEHGQYGRAYDEPAKESVYKTASYKVYRPNNDDAWIESTVHFNLSDVR